MASTPFVRLLLQGTIQSSQSWSVGVSVGTAALAGSAGMFTFLTNLVTATTTWWNATQGPGNLGGSDQKLLALRAYSYDSGATKSSAEASVTMNLTGAGTRIFPTQCALVVSLRSGISSRHGRGRMYLPLGIAGGTASGQLTSTTADNVATAAKTWLDVVGTTAVGGTTNNGIVIASGGSNDVVPVITIQVDTKIDTQRRRTDKIGPTYRAIQNL